jgi:hypothetical protein
MADDSTAQNGNGSNDGSDKPSEMFSALAAAAVKWTGAPTPDPNVSVSFSFGWHVAQAHAWALTGKRPQDDLGLEADLRWAVLDGQIKAGREQLATDANTDSGGSHAAGEPETGDSAAAGGDPQADAESDCPQASEEPQLGDRPPDRGDAEQAKQIKSLRDNLLRDLYIADSILGKAFLLGLELHALCVGPADAVGDAGAKDGEVEKALKDRAKVDRLLRDLASKLPPNAAHGVMNSLSLWDAQVDSRPQPPPTAGGIATSFRQQGFIWYSMLAGEVAAKDLLRLSDYVGTGEEMVKRLGDLALRALNSTTARLLGGVVLLLVALGLILIFVPDQGGHVAAGVTSLIAAFGLTWRGIGGFFGRAAAKGEQALWDAQVDWTIAYRCTVPVVEPGGGDHKRNRRTDHFDTWKAWLQRWPSLGGDDAGESVADRAGPGS